MYIDIGWEWEVYKRVMDMCTYIYHQDGIMSGVIFLCVELSRGMGESYWRDCQSSGRYPVGQLLVKRETKSTIPVPTTCKSESLG